MPARMTQHTTQFLTPSSIYTDSATESFKLTPSASEASVYIDAATEVLALDASPSTEGPIILTDTALEDLKFTPSGTDILTHLYQDTATERIKLTPVGFESDVAYFDASTELLSLQPTAVEEAQFGAPDTGVELLHLVPSSDDHFCPQKVEFEGWLQSRWDALRKNRWSATEEGRWQAQFLGVGEGFTC